MTAETRSPEEIEREIEQDRARLTDHLRSLQDQFSLDGAIGRMGEQLRLQGGELGQTLSRTVRDNPAAVALTGIGLAWLVFGGKSNGQAPDAWTGGAAPRPARDMPRDATPGDALPYGGGSSHAVRPGYGADPAHGSAPSGRSSADLTSRGMAGRNRPVPEWARDDDDDAPSSGMADRARAGIDRAGTAARAQGERANSAMAGMHDDAMGRADRLRERLARGTEKLSAEGRRRVTAAREAAVHARRRASDVMAQQGGQASELYAHQPLVAGAIALALGAAIGGALPRTRAEDDLMGIHSDWLMDEAERIYHEESRKLGEVVQAATDEARTVAREKQKELSDAVRGEEGKGVARAAKAEAETAGKRVSDAATKKAKDNKLGKVST